MFFLVVRGRGDIGRRREADVRVVQDEAEVYEVVLL